MNQTFNWLPTDSWVGSHPVIQPLPFEFQKISCSKPLAFPAHQHSISSTNRAHCTLRDEIHTPNPSWHRRHPIINSAKFAIGGINVPIEKYQRCQRYLEMWLKIFATFSTRAIWRCYSAVLRSNFLTHRTLHHLQAWPCNLYNHTKLNQNPHCNTTSLFRPSFQYGSLLSALQCAQYCRTAQTGM